MWFPDEKMKVNKFRIVDIPRPIEYMRRFGIAEMPSNSYTGDEYAPLPRNKVDMLADADRYDAMMQKVELEREQNNEGS